MLIDKQLDRMSFNLWKENFCNTVVESFSCLISSSTDKARTAKTGVNDAIK